MRGLSSAQLANSRAHLDCARAAAAGALQSHRTALDRATLYLNRRFSGNSPHSRRSDAAVVQPAVSTSEWDSEFILDSDKTSEEPSRREGASSWGAGRWGNTASGQRAASSSSGSGWGDDWDLGSDRRTHKSDQRGERGGRGRGGNGRQSSDWGSWQGNGSSRGTRGGRGNASSEGSWGRDGGGRPGRNRRDDSSAAASEDSWNSSSTGGIGGRRGVPLSCPTLSLRAVAWSLCVSLLIMACSALQLPDARRLYHP